MSSVRNTKQNGVLLHNQLLQPRMPDTAFVTVRDSTNLHCDWLKSDAAYRITEWFGLEGTLKIFWFQPPRHEHGHLPPDQVAQSSIQPGLQHFQVGGIHSFSGQPVPVFHHPHGEEFLSNI